MTLTGEQIAALARPARFYEQADSTNDLALAWLYEGVPSGAVVIADEQLRGRGRKGRTWHTPPGVALALSVILYPPVSALHQVSMLGAVAIAELAEHLGLDAVGIKWPNDVQVNGRKMSGVLPEVAWDGDQLRGVVLGMGVNVRVDFSGGPLEQTAISLETALNRRLDRFELVVYLLERVDYWSARFGSVALADAWKMRLNTVGQSVTVETPTGAVIGVAQAVDEQGALMVRDVNGRIHRVMAGDIALG
ncbi:MAG: biotin--[acetyl-CoA-carboxylase] ligase [Anaerolineae bacterium]|nr:biotin--[acetyl-CoA-carboxylase] ligase [Anaerolineae bacterium]